jgi:ABC-type branched-subunit amino acid transport system ATPase component
LLKVISQLDQSTPAGSQDSAALLSARGLRKSFGGQVVLDGVDLELRPGMVVLLDGENGSGKTTLINILTGNLEPDSGEVCYSTDSADLVYRFPQSIFNRLRPLHRFAPDTVARKGVGRTWQDVRMFETMSLRDNIAIAQPGQAGENPLWALLGRHSDGNGSTSAESVLKRVGLEGREESSGDMISLGQSKRVAILRAVAAGAKILFLDEPLAGLDRTGIDEVLGLLWELVADHDLTLVIVEHAFNQQHLRSMITERWHLASGKLTVCAPDTIISRSSTVPEWFQTLADAADEVITEQLPRGATLTRFRIAGRFEKEPILEIRDLRVKRGRRTVIGLDDQGQETGFNLTIYKGEIAVLQAPNGWGKSSLFDAVSGVIARSKKSFVNIFGREISSGTPADFARNGWYTAREHLFSTLSIFEYHRISKTIAAPGNFISKNNSLATLSGGQLQRFKLGGIANNTSVALLDEPFNGIDAEEVKTLVNKLIPSKFGCVIAVPIM